MQPESSSALGLLRIRREMQVGEQHLALAQHAALVRLRLLDLDDHVGAREDLGRAADDFGSGAAVHLVAQADAGAGHRLDDHRVAVMHQLADAARGQADTVFVRFDFLGHADEHGSILREWNDACVRTRPV